LEVFAGGVLVAVGWLGWGLGAGWVGWCVVVDGVAVAVAEGESVGLVGVAGDGELTVVVGAVVAGAQAGAVGGVGGSAVGPVGEVVDFEVGGGGAGRVAAGAVAVFDDDAGAAGHDPAGAAEVDRQPVVGPQWLDPCVAADLFGERGGRAGPWWIQAPWVSRWTMIVNSSRRDPDPIPVRERVHTSTRASSQVGWGLPAVNRASLASDRAWWMMAPSVLLVRAWR
jgi:hypothetical protein